MSRRTPPRRMNADADEPMNVSMMVRPVVPTLTPAHNTTTATLTHEKSLEDAALTLALNGTSASVGQTWLRLRVPGMIVHPHWQDFPPLPYAFHVCVGLFMVATAATSLVGNGLVLWSVVRFRSLRTSSNMFIISLAFADIAMSVVDFPLFAAASFFSYWPFGFHMCQLYGATTGIAGLVTINTLAAISFDRYTVMVHRVGPIRHISKQMTFLVITSIWLLSALWILAPLLGWSSFMLEGVGTTCTFDYLTTSAKNRSYVVTLIITNFVMPLIIIIYSYGRIFMSVASVKRGLMSCAHQIAVGNQTQRLRFHRQTELKTATNILMIVCFFCIAWTPYVIVAMIGMYGDVALVTPAVSALPCIFAKMATVSNPPLYSIGHPKFRKKISYLLRKTLLPRTPSAPTNTPPTTQDNPQTYL